MKIKSIQFVNNDVLKDFFISFTDEAGNVADTIILAGENGCGKTTILDAIYDFSQISTSGTVSNEKRIFEVVLNKKELNILLDKDDISKLLKSPTGDFRITQDFTKRPNYWHRVVVEYYSFDADVNKWLSIDSSHLFSNLDIKSSFKSIYSTVEINYNPGQIKTVTTEEVDQTTDKSIKSGSDIATKIKQMFIDIATNDALEVSSWVADNPGAAPPESVVNKRIKRFTRAFSQIFKNLNYERIENKDNQKDVLFHCNENEISISALSSGEKQIVFRGAFLLKDQQSTRGCIVLVDEPEISLHPNWQINILDFYKNLFLDEDNNQTSQIFMSTHSPFIIHNTNHTSDKVIIINKDENGRISIADKQEYYNCNRLDAIYTAFGISYFTPDQQTVYLEGRTDEKYFNRAVEVFGYDNLPFRFKWIGYLNDDGQDVNTGESALDKTVPFLISKNMAKKNVCLYDCDTNKKPKEKNNVYVRTIPTYENTKGMKKGIENAIVFDDIDLRPYYSEKTIEGDYGDDKTIRPFNKMACCDAVCKMDPTELKNVFINLKKEIDKLIEIFAKK